MLLHLGCSTQLQILSGVTNLRHHCIKIIRESFSDKDSKHRNSNTCFIAQGMWHIDNKSMFVAKWEQGLKFKLHTLTLALVWLDFREVPLHFFHEEGLQHIAGMLGKTLFLHPSTANMTNLDVARVYTIINPSKPLPEAVNVQFASGEICRIQVSSLWLPPTCGNYKVVGHTLKRCPSAPITCIDRNSPVHKTEDCPRKKRTL